LSGHGYKASRVSENRLGLYVLYGCYGGAIILPLPLALISGWLTGGVGQLPLLILLAAWQGVSSFTSESFADHHNELVVGLALFFYFAAFSVFAVPAHLLFRDRERAHLIALGLVTLGFAVLMAFAFPIRGLPI